MRTIIMSLDGSMRHKRGVVLFPDPPPGVDPKSLHEFDGVQLDTLRQWDVLYAQCSACKHQSLVNKYDLHKRWDNHYLRTLQEKLRCTKCGNRSGNKWILGRMARD